MMNVLTQLAEWLEELRQYREQYQWIPAEVRLPEAEDERGNSKDVLVVRQRYFRGKPVEGEVFMDVDYYNHELALWMGAPDPIIAWMPLPIYTGKEVRDE